MLENLKRIRQPVTWAVLVIICVSLVLGVVRLTQLVFWEKTQVFAAFQEIGQSIMNLSLVLALVALVCTCLFIPPATRRAITLAKLSAWVVGIGTLLQLICLALGLAASANAFGVIMEILGGLLDVSLKAVAAGVLWVLVRGVKSGRLDLAPAVPPAVAAPEAKAQPLWRADQATGTAWRSARDAASGARPDAGAVLEEPEAELPSAPERTWRPRPREGGQK
ncbi:hypothetical protein [Micropruina sp.]|uniref:hypothetical protein n=1 Tax=Micropruina sp. TaxID=2737536 RepID=UPI0039E36A8C